MSTQEVTIGIPKSRERRVILVAGSVVTDYSRPHPGSVVNDKKSDESSKITYGF